MLIHNCGSLSFGVKIYRGYISMVIAKFLTGQVSVEVKDIPVEVFDEFGEFLRQNTIPKHNFTFINGTLAQNVVSGTASEEDAEKIRKWFRERGAKTREEVLVE